MCVICAVCAILFDGQTLSIVAILCSHHTKCILLYRTASLCSHPDRKYSFHPKNDKYLWTNSKKWMRHKHCICLVYVARTHTYNRDPVPQRFLLHLPNANNDLQFERNKKKKRILWIDNLFSSIFIFTAAKIAFSSYSLYLSLAVILLLWMGMA